MKEKDLEALIRTGLNFTLPEYPKVITAKMLKRKLRFLQTQIRKQEQHTIKVSEVGTDWETRASQMTCARLYGMQEAYKSLLRSLEA